MVLAILVIAPRGGLHAQNGRSGSDFEIWADSAIWLRVDSLDVPFANPNSIHWIGGRLVITDPQGPSVTAIDPETGTILWQYRKEGHGPGEMISPDIAAWHPDGILVVDNRTRRLYVLSLDGVLISEVQVPHGVFVGSVCSYHDRSILIGYGGPPNYSILWMPFDSPEDAIPVAFPFSNGATNLNDAPMDFASSPPESSACLASRKTQDGIAAFAGTHLIAKGRFVEAVKQRPYKPFQEIQDTSDLPIPFSLSNGVLGHEAYVWFGGVRCTEHCIDFYSFPSLVYLRTVRMKVHSDIHIHTLTISGDKLYVLGARDGNPYMAAFRFPPSPRR